jgi:hypothetical protein
MKKDILSWNDVKQKYLEFHKMDKFTENMAIDIDFGYWLVNNYTIPHVVGRSEQLICHNCGKYKRMQGNGIMHQLCECGE